jgi:hypothetical protein
MIDLLCASLFVRPHQSWNHAILDILLFVGAENIDISALVLVFLACYKTLEFWIEYAYLSGTKMSCCSVQASCVMLIGLAMPYRSVPRVRPCGWIVLKSELRWSTTWWRGAAFWRRRLIDRWVLVGGIDHFPIATPNHIDSLGFVVWISSRINLGGWVLIAGHTGLLIRSVIAACWSRVEVETHMQIWIQEVPKAGEPTLQPPARTNCHRERSRWVCEASRELEVDRRCKLLLLFLSWVLKIVVFSCCEHRYSEQELRVHRELLVVDPWSHEFTRMNLSVPPLPDAPCRWSVVRYLK